uniref:Protein kinase domain-containing protein n=1 Tax=Oryza meridionalis TaxID=40149 RepID=A0A0E0BYV1_9ORYZ
MAEIVREGSGLASAAATGARPLPPPAPNPNLTTSRHLRARKSPTTPFAPPPSSSSDHPIPTRTRPSPPLRSAPASPTPQSRHRPASARGVVSSSSSSSSCDLRRVAAGLPLSGRRSSPVAMGARWGPRRATVGPHLRDALQFGELTALEVLDLSSNNLDGTIPEELMAMPLLKQLAGFKDWTSFSDLREKYSTNLASLGEPHIMQNLQSFASAVGRRLLGEVGNLPALSGNDAKSSGPVNSEEIQRAIDVLSLGSGSFSAFPNSEAEVLESAVNTDAAAMQSGAANQSTNEVSGSKHSKWAYFMIIPAAILLISLIVAPILVWRKRGHAAIGPWKTGLSGPLQKAFVTGVPKLNRPELEAACEDFSNIINTFPSCTVFKGTLSSGVEISVVSTAILSLKEWPKSSETCFRKKIDTLSRVNHKNFINLLGYCLENQPFMRMMVFEYAPNGTLSEHLHLKEFEHLDWAARMRIIMGVAYCLQYMHHDLNPPVAITDMRSDTIFMTDDYAAKIADVGIWKEVAIKAKSAKEDSSSRSQCPPDITSNVYCFGTLLIEIISGKLPEADDQESMCNWAAEHLKGKSYSKLVDASLKEHNANELEAVCEVIQECIDPDSDQRPTMRDVTRKLRQALNISPEAATPRLLPLWWAELEILSAEAT